MSGAQSPEQLAASVVSHGYAVLERAIAPQLVSELTASIDHAMAAFEVPFGAIANVGIASMLNSNAFTWWMSGLAGIVVGIIFNFTLSKFLVWKS